MTVSMNLHDCAVKEKQRAALLSGTGISRLPRSRAGTWGAGTVG